MKTSHLQKMALSIKQTILSKILAKNIHNISSSNFITNKQMLMNLCDLFQEKKPTEKTNKHILKS